MTVSVTLRAADYRGVKSAERPSGALIWRYRKEWCKQNRERFVLPPYLSPSTIICPVLEINLKIMECHTFAQSRGEESAVAWPLPKQLPLICCFFRHMKAPRWKSTAGDNVPWQQEMFPSFTRSSVKWNWVKVHHDQPPAGNKWGQVKCGSYRFYR